MTPERPAAFARALTIVKPVSRRRLYWTARGVFVSDQSRVPVFDHVFFTVFGNCLGEEPFEPEETSYTRPARRTRARRATAPPARHARAPHRGAADPARSRVAGSGAARSPAPAPRSAWAPSASTRSSRTSWRSSTG